MDTTVRATCPKCQTVLKIPSQWVGQAVKCKKCGSVVRSKPKASDTPLPQSPGEPQVVPVAPGSRAGQHAPTGVFDFSQSAPEDLDWPLPEPAVPPAPEQDDRFDPTGGADATAQPVPQPVPGYPYPLPPGYPPPAAYGVPPGYPYAPPPGYPYPVPPGYGYPVPPGYAPPGAYGVPPGYPYPVPPADPNAPAMPPAAPPGAPGAAYPYPVPYPVPGAPVPAAPAPVPAAPIPTTSAAQPAPPTKPSPRAVVPGPPVDPIASTSEFRTDTPPTSGRRYRRPQSKNKWIWVGVCVVLTAGLVAAGILGAKYLNENFAEKKPPDQYEKLVEQLASSEPGAREEAYAKLKAYGPKAEAALQEGAKSENADVARKCQELLALASGTPIPGGANPGTPVAKTGQFPRRMLFISISKYMYLNQLTYAEVDYQGIAGPDKTGPAAKYFAYSWNIPDNPKTPDGNQLFVLSDSAQSDNPKAEIPMPMKNVVMGTYEQFFATSRAQDRIVVYFGGHAIEKDGKAYVAPIEGDPDEPEASLIPLSEFYDKLKACKATQKVMIWDVCRFNPPRGRQRPGSEPMTESLYKALAAAPEGTEVVITCQPGENALEFSSIREPGSKYGDPRYAGSVFLEAMRTASSKTNRNAGKQPTPPDPIPVADWVAPVARRTGEMASWLSSYSDTGGEIPKMEASKSLKQTVKLEGKIPATQTAYNATEPLAKRFEMPTPPKGTAPAEIASIVNEFTVPPIKRDLADTGITDIAYREEVMKDFKEDVPLAEILADKEKYKFRVRTIAALDKVRSLWGKEDGGPKLRETIEEVGDKLKNEIKTEQEFWAFGIAELELLNTELDAVNSLKEGEPKRWQAHYEYARAVLKARLAYMNEYNKLLGDVLTETLPTLDPKLNQDRYRLASSEKMKSKRDVQKIAEEAKEAYLTLITEFKGTPWAIQAKRDKSFSLGLSWQPDASGKEPPKTP